MAKFDLTAVFDSIGKLCVQRLKRQFGQQRDLAGGMFSPRKVNRKVKIQTKRGTMRRGTLKRLFVTQSLARDGFLHKPHADGVSVGANTAVHPFGHIGYDKIVEYNSRGQASVNKHIDNPPMIFPTTASEVGLFFEREIKTGQRALANEMKRQMTEKGLVTMNQVVHLGS